ELHRFEVPDRQRAQTDKAHVARKDVPQLGKLVQPGEAEPSAEWRDISREFRPEKNICDAVGMFPGFPFPHRPEFIDAKTFAFEGYSAVLDVEGKCPRLPGGSEEKKSHHREQSRHERQREEDVENSFPEKIGFLWGHGEYA